MHAQVCLFFSLSLFCLLLILLKAGDSHKGLSSLHFSSVYLLWVFSRFHVVLMCDLEQGQRLGWVERTGRTRQRPEEAPERLMCAMWFPWMGFKMWSRQMKPKSFCHFKLLSVLYQLANMVLLQHSLGMQHCLPCLELHMIPFTLGAQIGCF